MINSLNTMNVVDMGKYYDISETKNNNEEI